MIDKARAKPLGFLGEYLYPCPLDKVLLEFIAVEPEAFLQVVSNKKDDEILRWLQANTLPHTPEAIEAWSRVFLNRGPEDEEGLRRFTKTRMRVAPERHDISAWVDLIDLDEGREVSRKIPS